MPDAHPWDDPAKKIEASKYCAWVFHDLFPQLVDCLNHTHGENHSARYWRIIIGPWFSHRIQAHYEKYTDPGCEFKTLEPIWMKEKPLGLLGTLKNAYAYALDFIGRTRPIIICDLHMSHLDAWRICFASRFKVWPMIRRVEHLADLHSEPEARTRLRRCKFTWGKDEFENVFLEGIADAVPSLYVENYRAMVESCKSFRRGNNKVLVSGTGWKSNERFKFIAAMAMERGAKIIGAQHGAGTGWSVCCPAEDFTRETVDGFITWDALNTTEKDIALPDPKLNRMFHARKRKIKNDAKFLFVGTSFPRYASAGIRTQPMSRQMLQYFDWQNRFFRAVGDLREKFIVRPYPAEYGWQNKIRLLQDFPKLNIDHFHASAVAHMKKCRLVVLDNPQTAFLEALALDVPCVLYFDPELWKMNAEAEAMFKNLSGFGIVHFTPESAAKHVEEIYYDPMEWWRKYADVTLPGRRCRLIKYSSGWPKEWARELNLGIIPLTGQTRRL